MSIIPNIYEALRAQNLANKYYKQKKKLFKQKFNEQYNNLKNEQQQILKKEKREAFRTGIASVFPYTIETEYKGNELKGSIFSVRTFPEAAKILGKLGIKKDNFGIVSNKNVDQIFLSAELIKQNPIRLAQDEKNRIVSISKNKTINAKDSVKFNKKTLFGGGN